MRICKLHGAGLLKLLFFCVFSFVLLSLNFYTNFLHSAEHSWFTSFDRDSERKIIGRLIKSRQDGIFSSGGLSVLGVTDEAASKDPFSFMNDKLDNYDAYINNVKIDHFASPYYSQICGQGIFLSILDKIIPYSPSIKLRLFHGVASLLTALILVAIIAWFYVECGLFAGLTVLGFCASLAMADVFTRNLWWFIWAFYLPMAMVMLYFQCTPKNRHSAVFQAGKHCFFFIPY